MSIEIDGPAGGQWTLIRGASGWTLWQGARPASDVAAARLRLSDDDAWRLLFNALPEPETQAALQSRAMILGEGRPELIAAFLRARSVIV